MYRDVAQLVARTAGGREVASSSLVIPTKFKTILIDGFKFGYGIMRAEQSGAVVLSGAIVELLIRELALC